MKRIPVIRMATLVLVFGTIAPAYAQHDQQDEKQSKSEKQQAKQPQQGAQPAQQQHATAATAAGRKQQQQQQQQQQDTRGQQPQQPQRQQDARGQQPQQQPQRQQDTRGQQPQQPQRQQDTRGQQPQAANSSASGQQQPQQQPQQQAAIRAATSRSNHSGSRMHAGNSRSNHNGSRIRAGNSRSNVLKNRHAPGNSREVGCSKVAGRGIVPGSRIAPNIGRTSIALGGSAAAMAVTTSRRTVSASILEVHTRSASGAAPRYSWDIPASSTAAFRSCSLTRGPNTGQKTGMIPTTFTLTMTTGITFIIVGIRVSGWRLPLYCS